MHNPVVNIGNQHIAIEGFCGAGGMSLGIAQAGFDIRVAFDYAEKAVETHNLNLGQSGLVRNAWDVKGRDLLERALTDEVDIFCGGPPCQGFSKQRRGAHLLDDPRNGLVLEYTRLVEEIRPKAFIFENVEIVGQKRGRDLIDEMIGRLRRYDIYPFMVDSSDFGLAQTRGRFILIGIHSELKAPTPFLLTSPNRMTVRDAIGDLPPPPADCKEHPKFANHMKCRITKENEERISHVPQGGGWQDIPYHLRLPCHQVVDTSSGGWPDVYGRLAWDGQCPTITAGFDSFSRGRYAHPEQNRSLTLREGARIQGFPDWFRFVGTRHDVRYQIGNAVPPPLAKAVGEAVKRSLEGVAHTGQRNAQFPDGHGCSSSQLAMAI